MKKLLTLLSLSAVAAAVAFGVASSNKGAMLANAVSYEEEISVAATGKDKFFVKTKAQESDEWTDLGAEELLPSGAGEIYSENPMQKTYWNEGHSYQAMGPFWDGCGEGDPRGETWTGYLQTRSWTQSKEKRFIYFTWGCAKDNETLPVSIIVHWDNSNGVQGQSDPIYNNTFSGVAMVFRYFEIPESAFKVSAESDELGDTNVWLEFVDQRETNYGGHTFGWLHVNQTFEDVQKAANDYYLALRSNSQENIKRHFRDNGALRDCAVDMNENFESSVDFYNNFFGVSDYDAHGNFAEQHHDNVISTAYSRSGTEMPYNKTDNGFFRGWYDDGPGGFVGADEPTYRFVSRPFILKGTGLISIKMAGSGASLYVIDAETGVDLAYVDNYQIGRPEEIAKDPSQKRPLRDNYAFRADGDESNIAASGKNTVTMVRHIINLDQYLGRTLKVAIADVTTSNWAAAYFDELITRYDEYPQFKVDSVMQDKDGIHYSHYTDIFVNSSPESADKNGIVYTDCSINTSLNVASHRDTSAPKKAYDVLLDYYSKFRQAGTNFSRCLPQGATSDETQAFNTKVSNFLSAYNSLDDDAQAIVRNAVDFDCSAMTGEQQWYDVDITRSTVGDAIARLSEGTQLANGFIKENAISTGSSTAAVVAALAGAGLIVGTSLLLIAKRRRKGE